MVLSTRVTSVYRAALTVLLLLLLSVASPCLLPAGGIIWVALLISNHYVSLSFRYNPSLGRTLGTDSLNFFRNIFAQRNWILRASLMRERHGNTICGNKSPLVEKFRILVSTLQNQACLCYSIIHEPEVQTWTPPNITEFKRLTSQNRPFSCHIDARWANFMPLWIT